MMSRSIHDALRLLMNPQSVAIVGASRSPGKIGHTVVAHLLRGGFAGAVYPVNPTGEPIEGLASTRTIADLPRDLDCAMLVIPAGGVVEAARACVAQGVKSLIIGASGFAESGTPQGVARQHALAALARDTGVRIIGPNTNGIFNGSARLSLGYNATHGEAIRPGGVSFISHSGALFGGVVRSAMAFGAGVSKFVPVGNEVDIGMLDVLDYLIDDPDTTVIGLVIEGLSDGRRLRAAARRAFLAGKPIVALKVGQSAAGAGAAQAHSSRLAGDARAYRALFGECGIAAVHSIEALAGGCAVLASTPAAPEDRRVVLVTSSGAGGALMADYAAARGFALAGLSDGEWDDAVVADLSGLTTMGRIRNPIDLGSLSGDWADLNTVLAAIERAGYRGPVAAFAHIGATPDMDRKLTDALVARKARTGAATVVLAPGGLLPAVEQAYAEAGLPLFRDSAACFDSLACAIGRRSEAPEELPAPPPRTAAATAGVLNEIDSATILRDTGVPMVESVIVTSAKHAQDAARRCGGRVVLKALPPGVAHKSKLGLVHAGVDEADVPRRYDALQDRLADLGFEAATVPVIVQPMMEANVELLVGLTRDAALGHFLVFGRGGVTVEEQNDVMLLPVPLSRARLHARVVASRLGGVLSSLVDEFVDLLDSVQRLAERYGDQLESIDINPVLIANRRLIAVDALVIFREA